MAIFEKLLRAGEGRILKKLKAITVAVNSLEEDFKKLSDDELRAMTDEFKERLGDGETLDDLLPEAFATVREAAWRVRGMRHYDVQIMGGAALHLGNIAEMKTGEGKTLVSTLPAYLNALSGKGVHIVTVNEYLARRDAEWMGEIHRFLGLTVGVVLPGEGSAKHREAYNCDITHGTNNEFAFDYLRDNMTSSLDDLVQRGHNFAIVDEADSILVDEARTPIIISGPAEHAPRWYKEFAGIVGRMKSGEHYDVDDAKRTVAVTEEGVAYVEDWLGIENLYESSNTPLVGYLNNAIKAKELFRRNKEYIVSDSGEVLIVDEFTGRVLPGRRFNEGIHQAIEALEGVEIKQENQTLASSTLQNYFRMYETLSGMTGTAMTEAGEFQRVYDTGVVPIPTHREMIRVDEPDVIYKTEEAKFAAVVDDIVERHEMGQPVLVGTVSVQKSEMLSQMLTKRGVKHDVLNAKNHSREADIIAQAGQKGAVTVATNMAGRGTDILLGGNPEFHAAADLRARNIDEADEETYAKEWEAALEKYEELCAQEGDEVRELGGLYVLGTERHDSRRIDNQLRGRTGRQGDPGRSRFYLSLSDDLMRRFNADAVKAMMNRLRVPDDVPIESKMVSKQIQSAQSQIEGHNAETRKNVLKFDEVMNKQRNVIYEERRTVLAGEDVSEQIRNMVDDVLEAYVHGATANGYAEDWDLDELWRALKLLYPIRITAEEVIKDADGIENLESPALLEAIQKDAHEYYTEREEEFGEKLIRNLERRVLLQVIDRKWREHLYEMDYLKEGINLRAYAQRNPVIEYQREGFDMFGVMLDGIKEDTMRFLFNAEIKPKKKDGEEESGAEAADEPEVNIRGLEPVSKPKQLRYSAPIIDGQAGSGGAVGVRETNAEDEVPAALRGNNNAKGEARKTVRAGSRRAVTPARAGRRPGPAGGGQAPPAQQANPQQARASQGPGRNDPCHCGSGKKFKRCHGAPSAK
ncbi:preprotein translocase subunit SecA [Natronoglycomyces albus]|uniref:Protein translocase subunit SecA n=1 Tax=Natronoglycomyces albus TaxID=2811108 RepID=A0A895XLQ9_9ACTN|nr:preprotein translocase subunit SecA [Natronoglycomyces albus]QSB04722.1 preprotein translocase subunit SecA [Natronoglycomyces albus]